MNTNKLKLCYTIILIIVVGRLFILPTQAIKNLKQKNNKIESDFLSFDAIDSMVYDYENEKVVFTSKNGKLSISATKDFIQDGYDDDLYISNEDIEVLSLSFDTEDSVYDYMEDKYAYLKDDSISIDERQDIKLNITNYNSYIINYNFNYEDYTYYTYFIMLKSDDKYILSLVGTKEDITDYNVEISNMISSIVLN